jgi:hypothetical protein
MSSEKSRQRIWIDRAIKNFLDNWTVISLLISGIVVLVMSVIVDFVQIQSIDKRFYLTFLYALGSFLVIILIEIRFSLRMEAKSLSHYYDGMNAAQDDIFKEISKHIKMRKTEPVLLRIYGMRLASISGILQAFITYSRNNNLGLRKLVVQIYCIAPEFLDNIELENKVLEIKLKNMFKTQSGRLKLDIQELKRTSNNHPLIKNIYFKKYSSIPSFWAYEIDREDIFWGYFTWDNYFENWMGPGNQCFYFNKNNQPINGFTDWIHNQIDGLEIWSLPWNDHELGENTDV